MLLDDTKYSKIGRSSTILECKFGVGVFNKKPYHVEVAPYWNVNLSMGWGKLYNFLVEVAPYWNVNLYKINSSL